MRVASPDRNEIYTCLIKGCVRFMYQQDWQFPAQTGQKGNAVIRVMLEIAVLGDIDLMGLEGSMSFSKCPGDSK